VAPVMQRLGPLAVYSNIFLVMLSLGVVAPMLSDVQRDLATSYAAIAWATGAFAVARLITDYPAGMASTRYPRALVLVIGSVAVCVGSLVASVASSVELFAVARAFSGVGSAITTTVGLTVILDAAPAERRGRASGLYHSALGAGAFFGPGFGGLIATVGGWRLAMAGAGVAALLSCALLVAVYATRSLPGGSGDERESKASEHPTEDSQRGWVIVMLRAAAPAYIAAFAIFYARGAAQFTLIPLAGRDIVGLTALELSLLLMASAAIGTLLGPFVGAWSDRVGRGRLLALGLIGLACGTVASTSATTMIPFTVGIGVVAFAGTTFSLPSSMIVDAVDPRRRGQAIGLYRVVGDAALSLGPILSGFLISRAGFGGTGLSVALVIAVSLVGWMVLARLARPDSLGEARSTV